MRWLRSLVVLTLCFGVTPGLGELVSDATHLIADGHSHHAEGHDEADGHEETDTEHGCTGWQHTCGCCASMSVAPAVAVLVLPAVAPNEIALAPDATGRRAKGVHDDLERPPRA